MKVLLDEQLPVKLKYRFHSNLEVLTVRDLKWLGMKDQELFLKMEEEHFDLFITNDQNLKFQMNYKKLPFSLIDLNFFSNRYDDLLTTMTNLNAALLLLENDIATKNVFIFDGVILKVWTNS